MYIKINQKANIKFITEIASEVRDRGILFGRGNKETSSKNMKFFKDG